MAVKLLIPWIALLLAGLILFGLSRQISLRWLPALWMRISLLLLLSLGLSKLQERKMQSEAAGFEVLVLDVSDSIDRNALDDALKQAEDWKEQQGGRLVLVFGEQSEILFADEPQQVLTTSSNISSAIEGAISFLNGERGKLIVATDGSISENPGLRDQLAHAADHQIDVSLILLPGRAYENDLYVGEILSPSRVWENSNFTVHLPIYSPRAQQVSVGISVNGSFQEEVELKVAAGENLAAVRLHASDPGIMLVGATVKMANDPFEFNNSVFSAFQVFPPPRVLLVSQGSQSVDKFSTILEDQDVVVNLVSTQQLITSRSQLAGYQAVLLFDLLAQDLNYEQLKGLETFVVEDGGSLVIFGGRNSYNLGGYENTLLEPILPVNLDAPDRIERHPTTYVMVLDRSGSMLQDDDSGIPPIELTKEAAIRAIENLRPEDYLGVLTFNSFTNWNVEISEVGSGISLRLAMDAVSQIKASGGTEISQALQEALAKIIETKPTNFRHILLMSDGASDNDEDTIERYEVLTSIARRQNITISTIALGYESDEESLSFIAQEGGGRFYQVFDPADLPGVMVSESKAAHSENIQLGETNPVAGIPAHPILSEIGLSDFPTIFGYNAVTSKAEVGAEDILLSGNFNDPLLSSWQVGHGHVVAWMGDMGAEWIPGMMSWRQAGEFWRQVIQYSLPNPEFSYSKVELMRGNGHVFVTLRALDNLGLPVNHLTPKFIYTDQSNQPFRFPMEQVRAGEYQVEVTEPQIGGYRGVVQYQTDGNLEEIGVPFVVNYPLEWRFNALRDDIEQLKKWSETGEIELTSFNILLNPGETANKWFGKAEPFEILLGMVLLLWPLEIAVRRLKLPWRKP